MLIANIVIFITSLFILIKASRFAVKEAIKLSHILGVSLLSIGFFLLATVTTLPELSVSIVSSVLKESQITVGNLLGSNIANILLIFGATSFVATIKVSKNQLKKIRLSLLLVSIISIIILVFNGVDRITGILLILTFAAFTYYFIRNDKKKRRKTEFSIIEKIKNIAFLLISLFIVILSTYFLVDSTKAIVVKAGLSEMLIGATIVAVGTSLPELSIAITAAKNKNYNLIIGNLMGSCVINLTFILGISSILNPISFALLPNILTLIVFINIANITFLFLCVDKIVWIIDGVILLFIYIIFILISSGLLVWKWLPL